MKNLRMLLLLSCLLALVGVSCAQKVGDIDRTQPNRTLKTDLEGVWYMLETVTDVPATAEATFEGETSKLEKIVWRVEESTLFGYRSYPLLPGADNVDAETDYTEPDYKEQPVAAFRILSHFDIQRQYSSATGEQTNVLVENSSDRPWFERDYMRVDWSTNHITNWDFISDWFATPIEGGYTIDEERDAQRGLYRERKDGELVYFDLPRKLLVSPDWIGCVLSWPWYARLYEDCTSAEIEVVTSFARTEAQRDYEPLPYDDHEMTRFGYFRSERYVYDPQRGVLESTRSQLANKHNIWAESYQRDSAGDYLRDSEGRRIPIPLSERSLRTIPYYLNTATPDEALLQKAVFETMEEWNQIAKEGAAEVTGRAIDTLGDIFVACHNPVRAGNDPACGEVGFSVRPGDLRFSTLQWIETETQAGLLGYGPSAADPVTGEIISGRAHVYGAAVNTYASYGLDVIRFMNGDLEPTELQNADHIREEVKARTERTLDMDRVDPSLRDIPLDRDKVRDRKVVERRDLGRESLRPFDKQAVMARLERASSTGLSRMVMNEEFQKSLSSVLKLSPQQMTQEDMAKVDPSKWFSPTHLQEAQQRRLKATARGVDYIDMFDPNVLGISRHYAGRDDYDQIWLELRAAVYKATALHEVGHTVGLRHNFQGSYDSLNYFDSYWAQRRKTLFEPNSLFDLYQLNALTDEQITEQMREYQYSSIMDYGLTFNSDLQGLGRYDRAAMVYAYTAGSSEKSVEGACEEGVQDAQGRCLVAQRGLIEVFGKSLDELGGAGQILSGQNSFGQYFEDPTTPIVPYLERYHYTVFMQSFPNLADAFDRDWMPMDSYLESRAAQAQDRPVRVPYLHCSDEWAGATMSCQRWDSGADPFERVQNIAQDYRAYYYFDYFKRDRFSWRPWSVLYNHFFRVFLPLSDIYQHWYLSPDGYDDVMDDYYWMAINMGFNLIAESIATPPYGTYCTGKNGQLFNLSDEQGYGPDQTSAYYLTVACDENAPFYEVAQGDGRRRFSVYDLDAGYNYPDRPLEAGHYWSTLAAFWAMIDPSAYVLGSDGDAGVYSISFYDIFDDEINALVNAVVTENYAAYSPLMEVTGNKGDNRIGSLHFTPQRYVYDSERRARINPETGEVISSSTGPRPSTALCDVCTSSAQCNGYTGANGGVYCQPIGEGTVFYCLQDCTGDPGQCQDDETCDERGNCVANSATCEGRIPECSRNQPYGTCDNGFACVGGTCVEPWPVVESDATFSLTDDMLYYGMLYSTASWSTRYNDQINVLKVGTDETIDPGEGFELVSFTDPILGSTYGAIRERCDVELPAGPRGLCETCNTDASCAGHTGRSGGTFCTNLDDTDQDYCLVDCSADASRCPAGTACGLDGNCRPQSDSCEGVPQACGPRSPMGSCQPGTTCIDGACQTTQPQSPRCKYNQDVQTGGLQMILRGQELTQRYNANLEAYWSDDGSDPERELALWRHFLRSQSEMENHLDKIQDIRSVYAIFGGIY